MTLEQGINYIKSMGLDRLHESFDKYNPVLKHIELKDDVFKLFYSIKKGEQFGMFMNTITIWDLEREMLLRRITLSKMNT